MKRDYVLQTEGTRDGRLPAVETAAEKRQHPRVPVSIDVEIVESTTRVRITGRATDFGVGGCYVDTKNVFAEGTPVDVFLHWQGRMLHLHALVSYAVKGESIGMGLSFTGTSAEAGATLLDWVTGFGDEPPQNPPIPPEPASNLASGGKTGPMGAPGLETTIGELVALLVRKHVLTESEGAQLRDSLSG